jgi:hypothetical protein
MLYSEIIAVCSEIHTKHINTLCGQNAECLNFVVNIKGKFVPAYIIKVYGGSRLTAPVIRNFDSAYTWWHRPIR